MKNKKIVMVIGGVLIFIGFVYLMNLFYKEPDLMPTCNVQNHTYYTRNPNPLLEEKIDGEYVLYGTIGKLIDNDEERKDFTTNCSKYHEKEVYVNPADDTYIYLKMGDKQYLKLQYEDHYPICYVNNHSYRRIEGLLGWQNSIPQGYESYGMIHELVDDNKKVDLSTNEKELIDREIFIHPSDDKKIYVKTSEYDQYLEFQLVP